LFAKARVEVTGDNKKELDKVIHRIVRKRYKNCPAAWKEVKKRIEKDEDAFALELKDAWSKRV